MERLVILTGQGQSGPSTVYSSMVALYPTYVFNAPRESDVDMSRSSGHQKLSPVAVAVASYLLVGGSY